MALVDFVKLVSAGAGVMAYCSSGELVRWALVRLPYGRRLLLSERTYREHEGAHRTKRRRASGSASGSWAAWNSERGEQVVGIDIPNRTPAS
jgi:hypothetical protein